MVAIVAVACSALGGCRAVQHPSSPTSSVAAFFSASGEDEDRRRAWEAWGRQNLCDGDLLFVMGESRILMGLLNFSKFSAEIAESEFSHVGVVAVENGEPVVYDVISDGAFRRPFGGYVIDRRVWSIAVRRLHPAHRECVPAALEFCRRVYREQGRFDTSFRRDNDRYYCAELVEVAFRSGGQSLADPIRIDQLPGFSQMSPILVGLVETTQPLTRDQEVFMPGNETYGLWSCPLLTTVLEKTDSHAPPPVTPLARLPSP